LWLFFVIFTNSFIKSILEQLIDKLNGGDLHRRLILFGLILVFFLYVSSLYAQEAPPESDSGEKITLNFDDEDVFAVIQTIFGDILKVNYIIDPQVKGRVNLRTVTPVSKKDVLPLMEVILKLNGIGIVEEKNLYRIVSISSMPGKGIKPRVFVYPVQNSKATDLAALLQQIFLGVKQQTSAQEKGASQLAPAPSQQPKAVTSSSGGGLITDFTTIFPDEVTNSIIILSTPEDYELISETIKKIDIVPRQVLIEGLIARVDLSDSLKFGLAWSLSTDLNFSLKPFNKDVNLNGEAGQRPSDLGTSARPATLSGTGFTFLATDASGIVRARLEALSTEGKVNVMAAPHILVSDNREAKIQVGQQVPIPTITTTNTVTSTSVQYKDIGIILKVKPQVNESGLVSLEITQEVSSSATSLEDISAGVSPVINKTEASTFLVAQSGETIIIGGLMREDTNKSKSGIPFFSNIPILGYLFGSTSKSVDKIELVILLTPHVIKNIGDAGSVTSDYMNKFKDSARDKKIDEFIDNSSKE
jgi:general secretion pathway protein D